MGVEVRDEAFVGKEFFVDKGRAEIVSDDCGVVVIFVGVSAGNCLGDGIHPTSHRSKPKDRAIFFIYLMLDIYNYWTLLAFPTIYRTFFHRQVKQG